MIIAKAVIPNQFWILKENDRKVGNIEVGPSGFSVKIGDQIQSYKSINTIKQKVKINFEPTVQTNAITETKKVHGYPTSGPAYNAIFDVKHQVPLWTREPRSKSWYAAGWYRVKHGRNWVTELCPKLITLQRYPYAGPFHTEKEANEPV